AEADVAADEPVHRPRRLEVLLDRLDRALLVLGLPIRELGLEALQPLVTQVEGLAFGLLAAGVERKEIARKLPQALAGPALQVLPGLAAELGERGRAGIRPDVARHLADLLVRDIEAVLAPEGEQQVVAGDAGDLLRLEGLQAADAVVLVDDVVARAEVGEALESAPKSGVRPGRTLAEDLRVGRQHESALAPDESSPSRSDREQKLRFVRQRLAGLEQSRLDPPKQVLRPQSLTPVREGNDDPLAGPYERAEL